jgi:hypothetical protein
MWLENFWNHPENQNNNPKSMGYYNLSRFQNYPLAQTPKWQELTKNQKQETQDLKNQLESPILEETRDELDKEALINEAKTMLYEKVWINETLESNWTMKKFLKGLVDWMILDNYDLAIEVWNTNWKIILDAIKQMASWEWLKQIAKALWESVWNLFTGNAYEKWKSVAELWLVATWLWVW